MLIAAVRGRHQRMPVLIMEQDQGAAPVDFARASNEPTRNTLIGENRLAMPINILEGCWWNGGGVRARPPQLGGPAGQRRRERDGRSRLGQER